MEEQNNQNFEEQKIEQPKVEEKRETILASTTHKKPFPKMVIGIIAFAVVAVAVLLIILLGGDKGDNVVCESCGASISESVKFCPDCGNSVKLPDNNNNNNNEITVNSSKELLNSIGDNKKIVLNGGKFNLYNVGSIANSKVEKDPAEFADEGYIISNITNLEIIGRGSLVVKGGDELWATGLQFVNCKNITLTDIDFTTSNNSELDWLQLLCFTECENITINNCTFSNCDTPIFISNSTSVVINNATIENIYSVYSEFSDIKITNSKISNFTTCFATSSSTITISNCEISDAKGLAYSYIIDDSLHWTGEGSDSIVNLENCIIKNNAISAIFAKTSGYGDSYSHNGIKFTACTISNNIYCNGALSGSNYVNCSFGNNSIGIEIPNMIDWSYTEESISQIGNDLKGINYSIEYVYDMDLTSNVVTPTFSIVDQSKVGIISKSNNNLVLTIAKPAITLEYIDWDINSAGGVEPDVKFKNNTDKQIAYVYFTVKYYDRMGTPAYCSIKDICQQRWKVTGPINAGATKITGWEPTIYNSAVGAIKPLSIEIIFTDGTKQVITSTGGYWYSGSYYGGELHD